MSADTGTPPFIPPEFQEYDSYSEAPGWQLKFSLVWATAIGVYALFCIPQLARAIRTRRALHDFLGVYENVDTYVALCDSGSGDDPSRRNEHMREVPRRDWRSFWRRILNTAGGFILWSVPGLELKLGQILVIVGYLLTVILCMVIKAPLIENPNRAGFIAIAQLPIVFLFATKNSILSLLFGPGNGYEKLNFVHRWAGRGMFIAALTHGSLWINNHLTWQFPIIGQQKETSGVACLGILCVVVITSFRSVRKAFYEFFFFVHILAFVAFFVTVCYHTIYAPPWIFPPLAFYGLDMLLRFFRYRIKDATLTPISNQMTLINIPFCTDGWTAGQHVRLRVFFDGRIFESHPFTILTAPPSTSCLSDVYSPGMTLGARAVGNWTRALNAFAINKGYLHSEDLHSEKGAICDNESTEYHSSGPQTQVQVMVDGPYGGCSLDLGEYETVLLLAGGAGVTFILGMLDDIVGRCVRLGRPNGERTRRIEFAWCVKSFGSIHWFASALTDLAHRTASSADSPMSLTLHVSVYVTCLCDPEAVPPIPNCDVTILRPNVHRILSDLVIPPLSFSPPSPSSSPREESISSSSASIKRGGFTSSTSTPNAQLADRNNQEINIVSEGGHVTTTHGKDIDIETTDGLDPHVSRKLPWVGDGGGVAVCASGPASLVREAANAVARLRLSRRGQEMGGVDLHTEVYAL